MAQDTDVQLIVRAITEGFSQVTADIERLGATTGKTGQEAAKSATKWTELNSQLSVVKRAFVGVKRAAEEVWQFLKEGADIELTASRFEKLAASIGSSGDEMLKAMQASTRGMVSNADIMANAGQIISLGLGKTEEEVVRLSTVVTKLGWDMSMVILTFANDSTRRLDSLGLSIEDVTGRAKLLEAQGYSTDKAFDLAVIEAGEAKIRLLGDAADTTAGDLKVLEASAQDAMNAIKAMALEAAKPAIGRAKDYATFAPGVAKAVDEMRASTEGAREELEKLANAYSQLDFSDANPVQAFLLRNSAVVKMAAKDMRDNVKEIILANVNWEGSTAEIGQELRALSPDLDLTVTGMVKFQNGTIGSVESLRQLAHALNEANLKAYSADMEELARAGRVGKESITLVDEAVRASNRAIAEHGMGIRMDTREMEDLAYATGELGTAQERMQQYLAEDKAKMDEASESAAAYASALKSITAATIGTQFNLIDDMAEQLEALRAAQGEWVSTTRDTSADIEAINARLAADLTDEQEKAWKKVAEDAEEGSARWLEAMRALDADLGEGQRNDLLIARAELEAAMGMPISVFTGDYTGMEEAKAKIEELTAAMQENYAQAILDATMAGGGFDEVAANTAVALGLMTRAQADARLEAVSLATTMTAIGEAIRSGAVTPEAAAGMFDSLTVAAQGTAADLKIAIDRIKAEIAGIDVVEANVDVTASTSAAGLKQAMLEMEGVLQPAADDAQAKLDNLNVTTVDIKVEDVELVDLKSLMIELQEKQGAISATVTQPPGDDSGLAPVKSSLASILDSINAINSTPVAPGSTAGSSASGGNQGGAAGRASGGPVTRGDPYVVGERGPELFVPDAPGRIIPNHIFQPPGRASGGPVSAGMSYVVGERGAEMFVPSSAPTRPNNVTQNIITNYTTGMGPEAVAAMIASSMTRYTRGSR